MSFNEAKYNKCFRLSNLDVVDSLFVQDHHWLYLFTLEGSRYSKIGISNDPVVRAKSIQNHCPINVSACDLWLYETKQKAMEKERQALNMTNRIRCSGEWIDLQKVESNTSFVELFFGLFRTLSSDSSMNFTLIKQKKKWVMIQ